MEAVTPVQAGAAAFLFCSQKYFLNF